MLSKSALGTLSALTILGIVAPVPRAQALPASDASSTEPQLEEIIVTATKRGAQDLQSVPISVTAFSSEALQNNGISNIGDLANFTAGLDIQKVAPGMTQIITRGVTLGGVTTGQPQVRATTATYINDVSFEQNGINPDPDLFDLERVEVLKGPQGTLFGSSAMAGAIRYVTKRPDLNVFSSRVVADGSFTKDGGGSYSAKGVVNVPLVNDTLAMRIMAYRNTNSGWIDNPVTGRSDINYDREAGARVSVFWQATEALSAHLMAQFQDMEVGSPPSAQLGDSSIWGPGPASVRDYKTYIGAGASFQDKFLLSTLELDWVLGDTTLSSLTGVVDRRFEQFRPGDLQEFMFASFGVDLPNPVFSDPYKSGKLSEELRVATRVGRFADLTAGAYFSNGHITYSSLMREDGWDQYAFDNFFTDPTTQGCLPQQPDAIFCGTQRNRERQHALYGQFDFHILPKLTLTAGGRYFKYEQFFDEKYGGFFNSGPTAKRQNFSEHGFNPKYGASYDVARQSLVYVTAAKGFRMGGVDDPVPNICAPDLAALGLTNYTGVFKSDSLWTYELGTKNTLADNRITLDAAVFDTEWSNIQTSTFLGTCGYSVTQNATKQRIRGLELGSRFALLRGLSLALNGNYTDAHLVGNAAPIRGHDGDSAPYTPRYSINGSIDYERALTEALGGFVRLSFNKRSDYGTEYNPSRSIEIPSQFVSNLRLGVQTEHYQWTLYVNNLTNELIVSNISAGRGGERDWNVGRPLTVGMQLQADF